MSRAKTTPLHYYMASALVTFVRHEGEGVEVPKQRHLNALIEVPRKAITSSSLNNARVAMFDRIRSEAGVEEKDLRDICFLSFSYLGNMKPADFYDLGAPNRPAAPPLQ